MSDDEVLEMIRAKTYEHAESVWPPRLCDLVGGVRIARGHDLIDEEGRTVIAGLEASLKRLVASGRLKRVRLRDWRDQGGPEWGYVLPDQGGQS
jgi:hypothetical protein